ncbi:MAG: hypothetical protein U0271_38685 [Polyangiaceae bacterium]
MVPALLIGANGLASVGCGQGIGGSGGSGGYGGEGGDSGSQTLRFDTEGTLELAPSETVTVDVITSGVASVTIVLLGNVADASIDRTVVETDASGHGSFTLHAPSAPGTFTLRAQIDTETWAELPVAVSEQGFTALRIKPTYNGKRDLSAGWSADVVVSSTCDAVLAQYPASPVGALHQDVTVHESPVIDSVPVGPTLTVAIRSGKVVAGCTTVTATTPNQAEDVEVVVIDRPVALAGAKLDISLEFHPDPDTYGALVQDGAYLAATTAFPEGTPYAVRLLDRIAYLLDPPEAALLGDLRLSPDLDLAVATTLDGVDPLTLCFDNKEAATGLALAGASDSTSSIQGQLVGTDDVTTTSFKLVSFVGLEASMVGAPDVANFTWSVSANDLMVIGGYLSIAPTRLAGAYLNAALSEIVGAPTTVTAELENATDCAGVAADILAAGSIGDCDAACLELTCHAAIESLWADGLAASDAQTSSAGALQIAMSGDAAVDADVVPTDVVGSWLGSVSALGHQAAVTGAAEGHAPPPQ